MTSFLSMPNINVSLMLGLISQQIITGLDITEIRDLLLNQSLVDLPSTLAVEINLGCKSTLTINQCVNASIYLLDQLVSTDLNPNLSQFIEETSVSCVSGIPHHLNDSQNMKYFDRFSGFGPSFIESSWLRILASVAVHSYFISLYNVSERYFKLNQLDVLKGVLELQSNVDEVFCCETTAYWGTQVGCSATGIRVEDRFPDLKFGYLEVKLFESLYSSTFSPTPPLRLLTSLSEPYYVMANPALVLDGLGDVRTSFQLFSIRGNRLDIVDYDYSINSCLSDQVFNVVESEDRFIFKGPNHQSDLLTYLASSTAPPFQISQVWVKMNGAGASVVNPLITVWPQGACIGLVDFIMEGSDPNLMSDYRLWLSNNSASIGDYIAMNISQKPNTCSSAKNLHLSAYALLLIGWLMKAVY